MSCLPDYKYSLAAVVNESNKTFDPSTLNKQAPDFWFENIYPIVL